MIQERPKLLVSNLLPGNTTPTFDVWFAQKVLGADGVEAHPKRYKGFYPTPGIESLHASYLSESSWAEVRHSADGLIGINQKAIKILVASFSYYSLYGRHDLEGFENLKKLSTLPLPIVVYWHQLRMAKTMFPEVNIQIARDLTQQVGSTPGEVVDFLKSQEDRQVFGSWDTYHSPSTGIRLEELISSNVHIPEVHVGISRADTGNHAFDIARVRSEVEMIPNKRRIVFEGYKPLSIRKMITQARTWDLMA